MVFWVDDVVWPQKYQFASMCQFAQACQVWKCYYGYYESYKYTIIFIPWIMYVYMYVDFYLAPVGIQRLCYCDTHGNILFLKGSFVHGTFWTPTLQGILWFKACPLVSLLVSA